MRLLSSCALLLACAAAFAAETSDSLIAKAAANAKASKKNVLVIFHASWCGWCHKFDDFLDKTPEGKLVKEGLEVVHITVMENPAHKADENPGGMELMKTLGGDQAGLPFMAILDARSKKMIVNSLTKEGDQRSNTGYPAAKEEVAHFLKMLAKGAPKISKDNVAKIGNWLTVNAPK
jgi:thiol-disulfide isomerase/thioredoxin